MQVAGSPSVLPPIAAAAGNSTASPPPSDVAAPPSGSQAAVTVTLSDAAAAALASPQTAAPPDGGVVAQVEQLAGVLADTSGASDAEKASALANLYQLRFESDGDGTDPSTDAWFSQSTPDQQKAVENEIESSTFFKQAVSAATLFNGAGVERARSGLPFDAAKTESARFSQLSPDQQLLVWAGGASQFKSLADFKDYLAQQTLGQAALARSLAATTAQSAASAPSDDPNGAAEAVKTLASKPAGSAADIALVLLTKGEAAKAKAASAAAPATATPAATAPAAMTPGTRISVAA